MAIAAAVMAKAAVLLESRVSLALNHCIWQSARLAHELQSSEMARPDLEDVVGTGGENEAAIRHTLPVDAHRAFIDLAIRLRGAARKASLFQHVRNPEPGRIHR
jgi:hypothetical protein